MNRVLRVVLIVLGTIIGLILMLLFVVGPFVTRPTTELSELAAEWQDRGSYFRRKSTLPENARLLLLDDGTGPFFTRYMNGTLFARGMNREMHSVPEGDRRVEGVATIIDYQNGGEVQHGTRNPDLASGRPCRSDSGGRLCVE